MSEVATINPQQIVPSDPQMAVIGMIERAARDPSIDLEKMERLLAWREREQERANRRAFDAAISAARAELPVIVKNREMNAGTGRTSYKYEDMAAIARAVDPVLSRHGLSYRFRTKAEADLITVTCVLTHSDGHFEENSLPARPDTSGSKNAIQSLGSTLTYLERYTLKAALGLATSADDDGNSHKGATEDNSLSIPDDGERLTKAQIGELRNLMEWKKAPESEFLKWAKVSSIDEIAPAYFASCKHALENYQART